MVEAAFLALAMVSKSPPAIISGEVVSVKNFELAGFAGILCSVDVDRDGDEEDFVVSESRGWRDEWIGGDWVAYEVLSKRIEEIDNGDTIRVLSYHFSFRADEKPPSVFVSVGFLDASGDGVLDIVVAMWDNEGFSQMMIYDLGGIEGDESPEITGLMPGLSWASYEIAWPVVKVSSPYGKREYVWKEGEWIDVK